MRLGLLGHIDDRSARIIVIRALRRRAPRNVNLRTRHVLLPRKGIARVQRRAEETRAFAHLPRDRHVGRTDQLAQGAVGEHAPLAGRARHAEHGQPRVLLGRLLELLRDRRERLFPADANPTGIVVVLGIGAFHGVVQPIGMIGGLNGRLRLVAAIAHRLEGALVSLDTDSSTVLNGHPNTAFHFAARATARSHSLNIIRSAAFHIRRGCRTQHGSAPRYGRSFEKPTARQRQHAHISSLSVAIIEQLILEASKDIARLSTNSSIKWMHRKGL